MPRRATTSSAADEVVRTVELSGGPLRVVIRRTERSLGLRVTIHPERGVVVSLPPTRRRGWARSDATVDAFLRDRERWIRRHLERRDSTHEQLRARPALHDGREIPYVGRPHRVRIVEAAGARRSDVERVGDDVDELVVSVSPRDRRPMARVLEAWLRERAMTAIDASIARNAALVGRAPSSVAMRDPRSRWGSCSPSGRLMVSWRLILAPPGALDSVVIHELCHLRHHDHDRRFRALLDRSAPDHRLWRQWLNRHRAELHAALSD